MPLAVSNRGHFDEKSGKDEGILPVVEGLTMDQKKEKGQQMGFDAGYVIERSQRYYSKLPGIWNK